MQAQRHLESVQQEQEAAIARRLVDANALYARSNSANTSPQGREMARSQAREAVQSVLMAEPTQVDALNLLGRIEMDEDNRESAWQVLNLALEVEPESAQTLTNLGYHALMSGEPETAKDHFEQALQQDRQSATAFAGVAHARRQCGEFDTAYLHYRRLLELGLEWPSVFAGMMECAQRLDVQRADQALARDAVRLLSQPDLPHQDLAGFVTAVLRGQYSNDLEADPWLLDAACEDELLLLGLENTLLTDPVLENLITQLRSSLVQEVRETGELFESRQRLALALALYVTRTGYAQMMSEEETHFVQELDRDLLQALKQAPQPDAIAGALIIRSLYGALFHQAYTPQIGAFDLADWPEGMQPLMAATYYDKAQEESYKQCFEEKQDELALAKEDLPHAWPCWQNLSHYTPQPLKTELEQSLGLTTEHWPETARILVIGAGSGQRAMELATYFTDVEVVAVDENLANLAHGQRRASEKGLENVVFWPYSLVSRFIGDGNRVQMIEVGHLPSENRSDVSVKELARQALDATGLLHIHTGEHGSSRVDIAIQRLMERHKLAPTTDTLRRLRRMILNNPDLEQYNELLSHPDFYATAGCRKRWFFPEDTNQLLSLMETLGNEVEWKLLRARDSDGQNLATTPVLKQLQAQSAGSRVQSLVGQSLNLYFQRRR